MAAFIKSLSRFLGSSSKPKPALYLAAFGKHPGWNDHLDDLGLDTDALIAAKRLLYVQGISQNIDSGAWDKLEAAATDASAVPEGTQVDNAVGRLDLFRHDFLWHMREDGSSVMLAGRFWSSSDGKGRDKYPMVVCSQLTELPARFAVHVVLPLCARTQEQCAATTSADTVRRILDTERENLRARIKDAIPPEPLTARQVAAVAAHSDMAEHVAGAAGAAGGGGGGFHRIVYQFLSGLAMYRPASAKSGTRSVSLPRPEQLRLPTCGMSAQDALLFWLRFAFTFLDASTPLLLISPDQPGAPWVDLIAGEPAPTNIFCIKAGTKSLPFTSDIPYTLDPSLVQAIDTHLAQCTSMPEDAPFPPWPAFS